jgi:hypothetical protein
MKPANGKRAIVIVVVGLLAVSLAATSGITYVTV